MKKLVLLGTLLLAVIHVGICQINFEKMSLNDAMMKASKENKKIFIDVYTTWCGPCKAMDANVFSDKKVGERMAKEFVCLKVDNEKGEFRSEVTKYGIKGYPTMLILDTKGLELGRIYGSKPLDDFNLELDKYTKQKESPISQAFAKLEDKSTGQKVWKETLVFLDDNVNSILNSNLYEVFIKACEDYYKKFEIATYDGVDDFKIFKHVTLPIEHPVVKLYLKTPGDNYASYSHKDYMVLAFKEEVKKATTDSQKAEIKTRAEKYYQEYSNRLGGDVEPKEDFMAKIFK